MARVSLYLSLLIVVFGKFTQQGTFTIPEHGDHLFLQMA
jgi:hypothetical protein